MVLLPDPNPFTAWSAPSHDLGRLLKHSSPWFHGVSGSFRAFAVLGSVIKRGNLTLYYILLANYLNGQLGTSLVVVVTL